MDTVPDWLIIWPPPAVENVGVPVMMSAAKTLETAQRVKGELVRLSLQKGSSVRLSLTTASMSPSLLPGDELIVESSQWQSLKTGDIVLCERGEVLLSHRLIRVARQAGGGVCLITKGDASGSYDSPVSIASYVGKVTRVIRGGRIISLAGRRARIAARLSVVRSVSSPVVARLAHRLSNCSWWPGS